MKKIKKTGVSLASSIRYWNKVVAGIYHCFII